MAISKPSMTLQWCEQIALITKTQPWEMTTEQPLCLEAGKGQGCQDLTLQPMSLNDPGPDKISTYK